MDQQAARRRRPTERGSYMFLESPRESTQRVSAHHSNSRSVCDSYWDAAGACFEPVAWQPRARALTSVGGGRQSVSGEDPHLSSLHTGEHDGSQLSESLTEISAKVAGLTDICLSLMERVKSVEGQLVIAHKHLLEKITDVNPIATRIADRLQTNDDFVTALGDKLAERITEVVESGARAELIAKDVVNMTVPLIENVITKALSRCKPPAAHLTPLLPRGLLPRSTGAPLADSLTFSDQSPTTDLNNSLLLTPNLISPFALYRSVGEPANNADDLNSVSQNTTCETLSIAPSIPAESDVAAQPVITPRPAEKSV